MNKLGYQFRSKNHLSRIIMIVVMFQLHGLIHHIYLTFKLKVEFGFLFFWQKVFHSIFKVQIEILGEQSIYKKIRSNCTVFSICNTLSFETLIVVYMTREVTKHTTIKLYRYPESASMIVVATKLYIYHKSAFHDSSNYHYPSYTRVM